jgi:hypothetical protein
MQYAEDSPVVHDKLTYIRIVSVANPSLEADFGGNAIAVIINIK